MQRLTGKNPVKHTRLYGFKNGTPNTTLLQGASRHTVAAGLTHDAVIACVLNAEYSLYSLFWAPRVPPRLATRKPEIGPVEKTADRVPSCRVLS